MTRFPWKLLAAALTSIASLQTCGTMAVAEIASANPSPLQGAPTVQLPADRRQLLVQKEGQLVAVPSATITAHGSATLIQTVTGTDQIRHIPRYVHIRASYGGIYPYVVVRSRSPFVVVNQDLDVLVLGLPEPVSAMISPPPSTTLVKQSDGTFVAQPQSPTVLQVILIESRIDPQIELPPGVPSALLLREDFSGATGSKREPTWGANRRLAYDVTNQHELLDEAGTRFRVFQVDLQ